VADASVMQQASKGMTIEAVGEPEAMGQLGKQAGGLDAVVTGALRRRGPNLVVECDLVATTDGSSLVKPSGVFALTDDGQGDLGRSWTTIDAQGMPLEGDASKQEGHPLLIDKFPFPIEIVSVQAEEGVAITDQTPRKKKEFKQRKIKDPRTGKERTELLIGARNGETFEISVSNKLQQRVAMMLLVDGINTLGQQRARLGKGRPWILDVEHEYAIPGWTFMPARSGEKALIKRFKFVGVAQSVAGRQKFGDSIGLITAGFYSERLGAGTSDTEYKIAVGEGQVEERQMNTTDFKVGGLLAVVNIRYVEESQLNR
jgi:hypothetical protein